MGIAHFVALHALPPPAQILEVGCGSGELAFAMSQQGYDVTAIDPEAPTGPLFRQVSLEHFSETTLFDTVVANRSLHHLEDLQAAVEKIHSLLRGGGVLILNEFAWDQMDEATAGWYLSQVDKSAPEDASLLPDNFPELWIAEHEGLHTSASMRNALDKRFHLRSFEWVPYVARYYLQRDDLVAQEAHLIKHGHINGVGFRYVGNRT
jgi:SAM-dependent methyltransferase